MNAVAWVTMLLVNANVARSPVTTNSTDTASRTGIGQRRRKHSASAGRAQHVRLDPADAQVGRHRRRAAGQFGPDHAREGQQEAEQYVVPLLLGGRAGPDPALDGRPGLRRCAGLGAHRLRT